MAEHAKLTAVARDLTGGSNPRRLRRQGLIPAVVYGGREGVRSVAVRDEDAVRAGVHENQLLELSLEGEAETLAMVKEVQLHYISHQILHIDLQRVAKGQQLTAEIPVVEVGEAIGVTRDGGILEHLLREIEVRCVPSDLPDEIRVDVSALEIGDVLTAGDLVLPDRVVLVTDPEQGVFTITTSRAAVAEEAEEGAEAAEGETPPPAEEEEAKS
ncbi:MAG TPA: 50S ribosomal protein L25 [bacterium]|nr:50S ribosomal protein L25 [bacterium]HPJ71948.1 50S ribosomal protein L25 [bacterium]HPQ66159.1 50S ribosomal protein L25 [bacterium]